MASIVSGSELAEQFCLGTGANKGPTVATLDLVTKKLKSWKDMAELTGEVDEAEFKQHEANLKQLWLELGFAQGDDGEGESKRAHASVTF